MRSPGRRRGFNLLEVMVSLGILVVSLLILMETQNSSVHATREAERLVTATHLAQDKLVEVLLLVEEEGFGEDELEDDGDFADWGDEELDLKFSNLEEYEFEWTVLEIDIGLAGDLTGMADSMAGSGYWGESNPDVASESDAGMGAPDLSAFGVSNEMITEMLGNFIREVRVVVWWGGDYDDAEERGDMVVITTHVINPSGSVLGFSGDSTRDPEGTAPPGTPPSRTPPRTPPSLPPGRP